MADATRGRLSSYAIERVALPPDTVHDVRRAFTTAGAGGRELALANCAAGIFAPMILARSEDAALEAAAHTLGEANAKSTPEDLFVPRVPVGIRELLETRVANSSASMESLRQRLCGERRDRAPSIVELAPVQVFNADRIAQQRAISGMIDPGMLVTGAVEELAAVPLSLSALYALSAGAPADEVVAGVRTCLGRVLRND